MFAPKVPRSLLGDLVARVAPDLARNPLRTAKHTSTYPLAEGDPKGALDIMGTILFKPYQDLGEGLFFDN